MSLLSFWIGLPHKGSEVAAHRLWGSIDRRGPRHGSRHSWFTFAPHVQMCSRVLFTEPKPTTLRHFADCGLRRVPSTAGRHSWAPLPLQVYSCTLVPLTSPLPATSMHLPNARSVPSLPTVQRCLAVPV